MAIDVQGAIVAQERSGIHIGQPVGLKNNAGKPGAGGDTVKEPAHARIHACQKGRDNKRAGSVPGREADLVGHFPGFGDWNKYNCSVGKAGSDPAGGMFNQPDDQAGNQEREEQNNDIFTALGIIFPDKDTDNHPGIDQAELFKEFPDIESYKAQSKILTRSRFFLLNLIYFEALIGWYR